MGKMRKAIFVDRDGVLCEDNHYVTSLDKLNIYSYSKEAVKILKDSGYLVIVITNQSAVARGLMTEDELLVINNVISSELKVDDIFYCPHLFDNSLGKSKYNIECNCRKPKIGMIVRAKIKHNIDLSKSYFVGDRKSDILAGKNSDVKTVLINSDINRTIDIDPDYRFDNILDFSMHLMQTDGGKDVKSNYE